MKIITSKKENIPIIEGESLKDFQNISHVKQNPGLHKWI